MDGPLLSIILCNKKEIIFKNYVIIQKKILINGSRFVINSFSFFCCYINACVFDR